MRARRIIRRVLIVVLLSTIAACSKPISSLLDDAEQLIAQADYRTAAIQLKNVLQKDPDNVEARWLLSQVYIELEAGADAEKELRRAEALGSPQQLITPALARALLLQGKTDDVLRLEPISDAPDESMADLAAARGLAYLAKGYTAVADEATADAIRLGPESRFVTSARARYLIAEKRLEEARKILNQLQETHPDYGIGWSLLGDIHTLEDDLANAESFYTRAADNRPGDMQDVFKRAQVRLRLQKREEALADLVSLTKTLPKLQPAWYLQGLIQYQNQDFGAAREALKRSQELNGGHVPTLLLLGWSDFMLGNLYQAEEAAQRAVTLMPNLVPARQLLANILLRQGRASEAEELVLPAAKAQPGNVAILLLLANSLMTQGDSAKATKVLEQIPGLAPTAATEQTRAGIALLWAGSPQAAVVVLEQAKELDPERADTNSALVAALLNTQAFDEALASAERFRELNPSDPGALRLVAFAHLARGEREPAMQMLREVLDVLPGDPKSSIALARLLDHDEKVEAATDVLETALANNTGNEDLLVALAQRAMQQGRAEQAKSYLLRATRTGTAGETARSMLAQQFLAEREPRRALDVLPGEARLDHPQLLRLRVQANLQLKALEDARNDLERLVRIESAAAEHRFQLASVYGALGERKKMRESLDKAAELAPDDPIIALAKARLHASDNELDAARRWLDKAASPADDPEVLRVRLMIASKENDIAEQVRLSEKLLEVQPSSQTVLQLAEAYLQSGQAGLRETLLEGWLHEHPGDPAVSLVLAKSYGDAGRPRDAVNLLRPLVEQHPGNTVFINNLAWHLREVDPAEAVVFAEKAYSAEPENSSILDTYAMVLARNGQFEQALRVLDRGIARASQPAYLQLQRINVLILSGDVVTAQEELEKLKAAGLPEGFTAQVNELEARLARRD